jgi:hypothetical protein
MTLARTGMAREMLREVAGMREVVATAETPSGADPVADAIITLRGGQAEDIRRVLRRADVVEPILVGHLIPLLARNDLFLDVLRPLRRAAPRTTGQLLDALLDLEQDAAVRRRIPRVLRGSPSQRAVDGLLQALSDPRFEVRRQCALTLARLTEREPSLTVSGTAVFAAIVRELQEGVVAWSEDGESAAAHLGPTETRPQTPAERGLAHVFALLSLVGEREPLRMAHWALGGQDPALRGTALEYLENVLPDDVTRALWPQLGLHGPTLRPRRPPHQIAHDLQRGSDTAGFGREALKRILPRR